MIKEFETEIRLLNEILEFEYDVEYTKTDTPYIKSKMNNNVLLLEKSVFENTSKNDMLIHIIEKLVTDKHPDLKSNINSVCIDFTHKAVISIHTFIKTAYINNDNDINEIKDYIKILKETLKESETQLSE